MQVRNTSERFHPKLFNEYKLKNNNNDICDVRFCQKHVFRILD